MTDFRDVLIDQPCYQVTPSTGVVHQVPCIRNNTLRPLPWPEFYDDRDRACIKCLPDGLPDVEVPAKRDGSWHLKFAIDYARRHI